MKLWIFFIFIRDMINQQRRIVPQYTRVCCSPTLGFWSQRGVGHGDSQAACWTRPFMCCVTVGTIDIQHTHHWVWHLVTATIVLFNTSLGRIEWQLISKDNITTSWRPLIMALTGTPFKKHSMPLLLVPGFQTQALGGRHQEVYRCASDVAGRVILWVF